MKFTHKFNMILNWYQLKYLPNNRLIKSMGYWLFIVPIAAKLLGTIDTPIILNFGDYVFKIDFSSE